MATLARRDDADLARGLQAWCGQRWPDAACRVTGMARPSAGWTNETLVVHLASDGRVPEQVVVRLPPPVPTWPSYDLAAQARVLDALAHGPVPVPRVLAFEADAGWLGDAFLVMSYEDGHVGGEAPALDAWITDRPVARQRVLHEAFVDTLAAVHRFDWRAHGLGDALRGGHRGHGGHGGATLADEVAWWRDYVDWAADGAPTAGLADAITWCAETVPTSDTPRSLCWGDARIGNVVFTDDGRVRAVLDWELAIVGPAESDVAWYLVLDELTTRFVGRSVPGFLARDELVAHYERQLGRELVDLPWHELFALTRSVAINERQARLAQAAGVAYPGVAGDANPVLRALTTRITRFTSG